MNGRTQKLKYSGLLDSPQITFYKIKIGKGAGRLINHHRRNVVTFSLVGTKHDDQMLYFYKNYSKSPAQPFYFVPNVLWSKKIQHLIS